VLERYGKSTLFWCEGRCNTQLDSATISVRKQRSVLGGRAHSGAIRERVQKARCHSAFLTLSLSLSVKRILLGR
jgi:hypothetical protein